MGDHPNGLEAAVVDRTREADRLWFAAHPGYGTRVRMLVPGEFAEVIDESQIDLVRVDQVTAGVRVRRPPSGVRVMESAS